MLVKRRLEKTHARATPLGNAWTIIEYLEHEARDHITNKSEAERDTDEKVFALLARRFGTGSSKIHIQQQFRTLNQNNEEDYMRYLDALEGFRSQGYPNEEVAVRRDEIMQKFIEGVRNFELKRNLALMYAQEQYVETHPTAEALRFTVQQYLLMHGSSRPENYQMAHHNNHNLYNPTYNRNCPGNSPTITTISTSSTSTASSLPTTTPKSMLQLRRPIKFRDQLPAKRSSTKTSATTSELLPYKPVWRMDLPITTTRNQQ